MKLKLIRYIIKRKISDIITYCMLGVSLILIRVGKRSMMVGVRMNRQKITQKIGIRLMFAGVNVGARLVELLEGGRER